MTRNEASKWLASQGAKVTSSVTKNTDVVIYLIHFAYLQIVALSKFQYLNFVLLLILNLHLHQQ
jgi:hypothetical protein